LLPTGNTPASERVARELSGLEPDKQREAWELAVEQSETGNPTAQEVACRRCGIPFNGHMGVIPIMSSCHGIVAPRAGPTQGGLVVTGGHLQVVKHPPKKIFKICPQRLQPAPKLSSRRGGQTAVLLGELQKLRARRKAAGIPAVRVATRADVERCRYSLLENGHLEPRPDELERLSAALQTLISERTRDLLALNAGEAI
jgi:hypothetical protein